MVAGDKQNPISLAEAVSRLENMEDGFARAAQTGLREYVRQVNAVGKDPGAYEKREQIQRELEASLLRQALKNLGSRHWLSSLWTKGSIRLDFQIQVLPTPTGIPAAIMQSVQAHAARNLKH